MHERLEREGWRQLLSETGEYLTPEVLSTPLAIEYLRKGKVGAEFVPHLIADAIATVGSGSANRRVYFELSQRRGLASVFAIVSHGYASQLATLQQRLAESVTNNVLGENTYDGYELVRGENEKLLARQMVLVTRLGRLSYASAVLVKMAHSQFELL